MTAARCIMILAMALLIGSFNARADEQPEPVAVGSFEILPIIDARGQAEKALLPGLAGHPELAPLFEHGPLPSVSKTYFLKDGAHNVLFDTGWGQELGKKGETQAVLAQHGIKPQDITDIVLTHLDFDHIGGMLTGGKAVFPNATIWIAAPELAAWQGGDITNRPDFAKQLARDVAAIYKDRIKTFNYGDEILPGIVAVDARGHTPGHTAYEVGTGPEKMIIVGDLVHVGQVQFAHPELSAIYDMNPEQAAAARIRLLNHAADSGQQAAGMHFEMVSPVRKRSDSGFMIREPR